MKMDREQKTRKLGGHIPGFAGYGAVHYLETDFLLRRRLVGEIEKVRDRLADLIAAGHRPGELREKLALSLKTAAFLKAELMPVPGDVPEGLNLTPLAEERLFDFDLVLLEKAAALHAFLDRMEAPEAPDEVAEVLGLLDEGLAEVDDLNLRRRQLLQGSPP